MMRNRRNNAYSDEVELHVPTPDGTARRTIMAAPFVAAFVAASALPAAAAPVEPDPSADANTAALLEDPLSLSRSALSAAIGKEAVREGSAFADVAKHPGVDATGVTECSTALQAALNAVGSANGRAYAKGIFKISKTVTFIGPADFTDAVFNYTATSGLAVQVGNPASRVFRTEYRLPRVVATAKTGTGWAAVAGSSGVRLTNLYSCTVTVPHVQNFETGLIGHGMGPNGTAYTVIHLGHLDNNKVNLLLKPDDTGAKATSGWFNQNMFIGGRASHESAEGQDVAGTKHIHIAPSSNTANNNRFISTSVESPGVVQYHIDCHGHYNIFDQCRFENTSTRDKRRVIWRAASKYNVISGGFGAGQLTEIVEPGAMNDLRSEETNRYVGGTVLDPLMALENPGSSAAPILRGLPAGTVASGANQSTAWSWDLSANKLRGKRAGDAAPRLELDFANGIMKSGTGAANPTKGFGVRANVHELAGAVTQTTAPPVGAGAALPARPAGYMQILVGTTVRWIPYY
jgi:hypothetical protein